MLTLAIIWFVTWAVLFTLDVAFENRSYPKIGALAIFLSCLTLGILVGHWAKHPPPIERMTQVEATMLIASGPDKGFYQLRTAATLPKVTHTLCFDGGHCGPAKSIDDSDEYDDSKSVGLNWGKVIYCMDCAKTEVCANGGGGAIARWDGSVWRCK